jgi:hypothetical protein
MTRKLIAGLVLAIVAALSVPSAASATTYIPGSGCTVSPSRLKAGETGTLRCDPGTYGASESVDYVIAGQWGANVTLASFHAGASSASIMKLAAADGSSTLSVTVPADATGAYTITGTGVTTSSTATAAITVLPADASIASTTDVADSSAIAPSGWNFAMLLIWIGAGILALGLIGLLVLAALRRRRQLPHHKHAN